VLDWFGGQSEVDMLNCGFSGMLRDLFGGVWGWWVCGGDTFGCMYGLIDDVV
jgi:hypothetical protein